MLNLVVLSFNTLYKIMIIVNKRKKDIRNRILKDNTPKANNAFRNCTIPKSHFQKKRNNDGTKLLIS